MDGGVEAEAPATGTPPGRAGESGGAPPEEAPPSLLRDYFETVLIAVLIVLFLQTYLFQQSKIPSSSMEETLLVGDHILVNNFVFSTDLAASPLLPHREPRRGDVVVFKPPHRPDMDFIKRVVGLPGETLRIREGSILIDGRPLDEPYAFFVNPEGSVEREFGPVHIPPGHYFLMGDNRDVSEDSRKFQAVPRECIRGRAVLIWFSLQQPMEPYEPDPRIRFARAWVRMLTFPGRVRWDRLLVPIR